MGSPMPPSGTALCLCLMPLPYAYCLLPYASAVRETVANYLDSARRPSSTAEHITYPEVHGEEEEVAHDAGEDAFRGIKVFNIEAEGGGGAGQEDVGDLSGRRVREGEGGVVLFNIENNSGDNAGGGPHLKIRTGAGHSFIGYCHPLSFGFGF
jgi:hypothetical protein